MSHYMNQIGVCSKFKTCISAALRHLPWGARRTDWKSWTLLCYMLIPLRGKIAPPPNACRSANNDHEDILFWNESISPARVTLSVCVSACQCMDVCHEVRAAVCDVWQVVLWLTRPLCCSVTYLSSLTCSSGSAHATWSTCASQLIGPLLVYQVSPGNLFRHTCPLI